MSKSAPLNKEYRFWKLGIAHPLLKLFKIHFSCGALITFALSGGAPGIERTGTNLPRLDPVKAFLVFPAVLLEQLVRIFLLCPALDCAEFTASVSIFIYSEIAELCRVSPWDSEIFAAVGADTHTLFALDALTD